MLCGHFALIAIEHLISIQLKLIFDWNGIRVYYWIKLSKMYVLHVTSGGAAWFTTIANDIDTLSFYYRWFIYSQCNCCLVLLDNTTILRERIEITN